MPDICNYMPIQFMNNAGRCFHVQYDTDLVFLLIGITSLHLPLNPIQLPTALNLATLGILAPHRQPHSMPYAPITPNIPQPLDIIQPLPPLVILNLHPRQFGGEIYQFLVV